MCKFSHISYDMKGKIKEVTKEINSKTVGLMKVFVDHMYVPDGKDMSTNMLFIYAHICLLFEQNVFHL